MSRPHAVSVADYCFSFVEKRAVDVKITVGVNTAVADIFPVEQHNAVVGKHPFRTCKNLCTAEHASTPDGQPHLLFTADLAVLI